MASATEDGIRRASDLAVAWDYSVLPSTGPRSRSEPVLSDEAAPRACFFVHAVTSATRRQLCHGCLRSQSTYMTPVVPAACCQREQSSFALRPFSSLFAFVLVLFVTTRSQF